MKVTYTPLFDTTPPIRVTLSTEYFYSAYQISLADAKDLAASLAAAIRQAEEAK